MLKYIKDIADDLLHIVTGKRCADQLKFVFQALADELARLDPRDFLPQGRHEFVKILVSVRFNASLSGYTKAFFHQYELLAKRISAVLDLYGGEGSKAVTRNFSFIIEPALRNIVERDYKELSLILFPSGAWKSTVILAGSILEAILFDQLSQPLYLKKAESSPKAPKHKGIFQQFSRSRSTTHRHPSR